MASFNHFFRWVFSFLIVLNSVSAAQQKTPTPRLPLVHHFDTTRPATPATISPDLKTFYYKQTLDHFNFYPESYTTFNQRYVINFKHWGGAKTNAPILAYLGAEAPLDGDLSTIGFLSENAPRFKALQVYIEHRFYGKSNPLGSMEEALQNESIRGYFNSAQALADYAEVLVYLKKKFSAYRSPVIVVGGSYGGMLASWFRLKYPHVALGALASSAPLLYFDDITPQSGYHSLATKDFKEVSESCYKIIKISWSEIDAIAAKPHGLSFLSKKFKTCTPLSNSDELKSYLESLYISVAQYDSPPTYPVTVVCGGIDGAPKGTDVLGRIFAGLAAYRPNEKCYETKSQPSETSQGWSWQQCSDLLFPQGRGSNTMFPPAPFNLTERIEYCKDIYGVEPRPHWVTTYYGGHDIKLVLEKFASNIIFSNGLRDPYSSAGVLENISDSLIALSTTNGSHCLDVLPAQPTDPQWLVMQRKTEVKIIEGWFQKYYSSLYATQK